MTRRVYDAAVNKNLFSEQPNCKTESDQHNNQPFREANDILPPSLIAILISAAREARGAFSSRLILQ